MSGWSAIRAEIPGLLLLSIPIVVGLGASTLLGVTDSLMLAPLGPVPLAAVGLTMAVAIIFSRRFMACYRRFRCASARLSGQVGRARYHLFCAMGWRWGRWSGFAGR